MLFYLIFYLLHAQVLYDIVCNNNLQIITNINSEIESLNLEIEVVGQAHLRLNYLGCLNNLLTSQLSTTFLPNLNRVSFLIEARIIEDCGPGWSALDNTLVTHYLKNTSSKTKAVEISRPGESHATEAKELHTLMPRCAQLGVLRSHRGYPIRPWTLMDMPIWHLFQVTYPGQTAAVLF